MRDAVPTEIWPLHWTVRVNPGNETQQAIKKNLEELRDIVQKLVFA